MLIVDALRRRLPRSRRCPGSRFTSSRATGRITVDGDLSDEGWKNATRVEKWYEINPGDNTEPKVRNVAYLTYDDKFFYAAFEFDDPNPAAIKAPFNDRDNVPGFTDYGGVILDTRNDGHRAVMMLANAHGIQYDAISDDASGEDSSPDFFWDSAARITPRGWTLELRIPFSSLRYRNIDPQSWGILLYRNYPREFRYQMFSASLPRGTATASSAVRTRCWASNASPRADTLSPRRTRAPAPTRIPAAISERRSWPIRSSRTSASTSSGRRTRTTSST